MIGQAGIVLWRSILFALRLTLFVRAYAVQRAKPQIMLISVIKICLIALRDADRRTRWDVNDHMIIAHTLDRLRRLRERIGIPP